MIGFRNGVPARVLRLPAGVDSKAVADEMEMEGAYDVIVRAQVFEQRTLSRAEGEQS